MSLAAYRKEFPFLGFAVYALEPNGPVTLEVHHKGRVHTLVGDDMDQLFIDAFGVLEAEPEPKKELTVFD